MSWYFSNDKPIFQQLVDIITTDIIIGKYKLGAKLDTVRDLAVEAGVNPNTMQRALAEIEETGIIYTKRGDGRYVTEDYSKIASIKEKYVNGYTEKYIESLKNLGLNNDEIAEAVKKLLKYGYFPYGCLRVTD